MKRKIKEILITLCVIGTVFAVSGCEEQTAEHMPDQPAVSVTAEPESTAPPDFIVFNDERIRLRDYASLISFFGQLSYENVTIEDEGDFIDVAEEYGLENLYDLYSYINSLSDPEAGDLHRIMLEALNNA